MANEKDREYFTSDKMVQAIMHVIMGAVMRFSYITRVILKWGEGFTAYTDGKEVAMDWDNELLSDSPTREERYRRGIGMILHECGHILFTARDKAVKKYEEWEKSGKIPEAPHINDAIANKKLTVAQAVKLIHTVSNMIEDGFIEIVLLKMYPGYGACLQILRDKQLAESVSLGDMLKQGYERTAIILNMILDYAKYGVMLGERSEDPEIWDAIVNVKPLLDEARSETKFSKRFELSIKVADELWLVLEKEYNQQAMQQYQHGGESGQSQPQNGEGQQSSSQGQSGSQSEQSSSQKSESEKSSDENRNDSSSTAESEQNGNEAGNGSSGSESAGQETSEDGSQGDSQDGSNSGSEDQNGSGNSKSQSGEDGQEESGASGSGNDEQSSTQTQNRSHADGDLGKLLEKALKNTEEDNSTGGQLAERYDNLDEVNPEKDEKPKAFNDLLKEIKVELANKPEKACLEKLGPVMRTRYNTPFFVKELKGLLPQRYIIDDGRKWVNRLSNEYRRQVNDKREYSLIDGLYSGTKLCEPYRKDMKRFGKDILPDEPSDLDITLLIDMSSSMYSSIRANDMNCTTSKASAAMKSAIAVTAFAKRMPEMKIAVWGHNRTGNGTQLFKIAGR